MPPISLVHELEVICRAIDSLHQYIDRKSQELHTTEELLRNKHAFNHRQQALIGHALRHPGMRYTVEGHRGSHAVVYQTARADLLELQQLGLLEKSKFGKAFSFQAPPDLAERLKHPDDTP